MSLPLIEIVAGNGVLIFLNFLGVLDLFLSSELLFGIGTLVSPRFDEEVVSKIFSMISMNYTKTIILYSTYLHGMKVISKVTMLTQLLVKVL